MVCGDKRRGEQEGDRLGRDEKSSLLSKNEGLLNWGGYSKSRKERLVRKYILELEGLL
jgi:hypothetical protein